MKIVKGCPRDKWEEVQAIQDEPFIYIQYNGSHWLGEEESDVEALAEMLRSYALRPDGFSFYSLNPCRGVEDPNRRGHYIDGPRLYRVDGVYRFSGNFYEYSHAFGIDTNHKPTIELLTTLIDANVASTGYLKAQAEMVQAETNCREVQELKDRQRRAQRIAEALSILQSEVIQ